MLNLTHIEWIHSLKFLLSSSIRYLQLENLTRKGFVSLSPVSKVLGQFPLLTVEFYVFLRNLKRDKN